MYILNIIFFFLNTIVYFNASCILRMYRHIVPYLLVCVCVRACVCATVNCFQFLCFAFDKVETVSSFYIK